MDIAYLRKHGLIVLEVVSGSRAYNLHTPSSDTDIKGVFILPKTLYYGLDYTPQINNETNDVVFYELRRFMELLAVNNPNILELLNTPPEAVIYRHSLIEKIDSQRIISKLCKDTFGKFALAQIKKAKGLNKKISNPMSEARKTILDFCYVNHEQGSVSLSRFLALRGWAQQHCGLVNIANMENIYGLYYNEQQPYSGIQRNENANDIALSAIPKGESMIALLYFNKNGYSTYCKEYREYWDWVAKRNEVRYENTTQHGKNYDAKNMMHTFRLLAMAKEIGEQQAIIVQRPDRAFLLRIKTGDFEYDDLLLRANALQTEIETIYATSTLRDTPDLAYLNQVAFELRERWYAL